MANFLKVVTPKKKTSELTEINSFGLAFFALCCVLKIKFLNF